MKREECREWKQARQRILNMKSQEEVRWLTPTSHSSKHLTQWSAEAVSAGVIDRSPSTLSYYIASIKGEGLY